MKKGPAVPGWAIGVGIAAVVAVAGFFLLKAGGGEGPRDPSTYPKSAYSPPGYSQTPGGPGGGGDYKSRANRPNPNGGSGQGSGSPYGGPSSVPGGYPGGSR